MIELSLVQKIILRVWGYVGVGSRMKDGWRDPIKHYAFKCLEHGIVVDYPHGYTKYLNCPQCQQSASTRTDEI